MLDFLLEASIKEDVSKSLAEDIGSGDITAQLIPEDKQANARLITRETAIFCGKIWAEEVFRQIDPTIKLRWFVSDGDSISPDSTLFETTGNARSLLTAERAALNFIQTLSGTATNARTYCDAVSHTQCKILDTRKTLPGLRVAQKYAARTGGCQNHRIGLYDAFLIKENHIQACGSIHTAVAEAHKIAPGKPVEVEVENLEELELAIAAGSDIIMLDNFSTDQLKQAVSINRGKAKLEASGGIDSNTLVPIAETGVDYISIGAITKHCQAIDLSMRFY